MIHEFLTNKWILGAVGFIIMFAGVCYLWYQHQVAPYEKQAADTAEIVHQLEKKPTGATEKQHSRTNHRGRSYG